MKDRRMSKKTFIRYSGKLTFVVLQVMLAVGFVKCLTGANYSQYFPVVLASQVALNTTVWAAAGFSDHRKERNLKNYMDAEQ